MTPPWLPRTTAQVTLRRLLPSDLRTFQSYRQDAEIGRYQGWQSISDDEAVAFLNEVATEPLLQPGQWSQIAIALPPTDALVGDIGVCVAVDGAQAEIGFTLARGAQGRGLGAAGEGAAIALLFERTAVQRIVAITDARNAASIRLLDRLGVTLLYSEHAVFHGEPCLEHHYGLERR